MSLVCLATLFALAEPALAMRKGHGPDHGRDDISRRDIEDAQRAWCDALIEVGRVAAEGGDVRAAANDMLSDIYNYDAGQVLFKPTLTSGNQTFRLTRRGALSYFIDDDPKFPNDTGFALKEWVECKPKIVGTFSQDGVALAQGEMFLKDVKGNEVTADMSFGYIRGDDGELRIVLHHSSLHNDSPSSG
jgi:hypothetical protein